MSGRTGKRLNITFHNPNAQEKTVKYLTGIIAENLAEYIINKKAIVTLNERCEALQEALAEPPNHSY